MGRIGGVIVRCWLVVIVCSANSVPLASALEASGQGESTYEEYDDESPYLGGYELLDDLDSSVEELATVYDEDVLDPITDDDISYSGYEYEDPLDDDIGVGGSDGVVDSVVPSSISSSTVVTPSMTTLEDAVQRHTVAIENGTISAVEAGTTSTLAMPEKEDDGLGTPLLDGLGASGSTAPPPTTVEDDSCRGHEKLPTQPEYVSRDASIMRKCCPPGESLVSEHSKHVSCQKDAPSSYLPQPIVAQFYRDCIEDLEEELRLDVRYGNPCPSEGGMVSFGAHTNDTLYVIQNGSLLVIYGGKDYDVYDTYCLDYDRTDGALLAYVCPSEVRVMVDVVKGQLFLLTICLIVAIPALLVTALLYIIVPKLHDLHGRALAMNCVNFAIALLLECFFQYRNRGKRMLMDDMVLENYAEYFILATFFWLLVNCGNNCFHAWYYVPRGKKANTLEDNQRFALYAAFAQLIPLWIILSYSMTPAGTPAIKHYLFIPIGVTLGLGSLCLLVTLLGLTRLKNCYYTCHQIRQRLVQSGQYEELCKYVPVCGRKVNKVIYMNKYTVPLFVVMGTIWTVMAVTYYATYDLPIFYDILFGFQGILMFVIFVCMPRPYETIRQWLNERRYCAWMCRVDQVDDGEEAPMKRQMIAPMMARAAPRVACVPDAAQYNAYMGGPERLKLNKNPFKYLEEF
ncbi:probable G-protein coupled receptor Mth-like 14 isoform X1 [Anopheles gambiae]|nr:probable G-protein coupled receptor Mth-like 14 isoform X1 [Anopheles gambiae]